MSTPQDSSPPPPGPDNGGNDKIAERAISGSAYSVGAAVLTWSLGAVRLILMMRLLTPAVFGVFTQAMLFLTLAMELSSFGLNNALIHRQKADQRVYATYFVLKVAFMSITLLLLVLVTPALSTQYPDIPELSRVLLVLIALEPIRLLNNMQTTVLTKRLEFRRLSIANIVGSLIMTLVAPTFAWLGF